MTESFDASKALKKATGRAKSDVANKLVSMLLHEISRKACASGQLTVPDVSYRAAVSKSFGNSCIYCSLPLVKDRTAVEHLNGMNRTRVGLHVPGNVAVSCRKCNTEKRRDDQKINLALAPSGWQAFLSHDGSKCENNCKTCLYWKSIYPSIKHRTSYLTERIKVIQAFQEPFSQFLRWSDEARDAIHTQVETLYRDCQSFATSEIAVLTEKIKFDFR